MQDIICYNIAPLCWRLWRTFACVDRSINATLAALETKLTLHTRTTKYTSGSTTYSYTEKGIKHGAFYITNISKYEARGTYRLGVLHGTVVIKSRFIRTVNYHNGRLHGVYKSEAVNETSYRISNYKYGILHGPIYWKYKYVDETRIVEATYVDGIIHGHEFTKIFIGDKEFTGYTRITDMGISQGRTVLYDKIKTPQGIEYIPALCVDYKDGKPEHIHLSKNEVSEYKWIYKYNKIYMECWKNGDLSHSGDASLCGYMSEVVMCNEKNIRPTRDIYEARYRNLNGACMEYYENRTLLFNEDSYRGLQTMYYNRQYLQHGPYITFNSVGKAIEIVTFMDGFKHGLHKSYLIMTDPLYMNYQFDCNLGVRIND